MKFSDDLIKQTQRVFAEEHDHHISEETANEYLESFARLYEAFTGKLEPGPSKTNQ